ncbi:WxL domain-containing protein [Enterococcus casseliflavus]|uniref:WxL domain-containing protein n=1 Tax=Enterococcus casseliflavus TaxID=37734 RepID=UPI0039A6EE49
MTKRLRKPMLLLGTTILVMQAVFMPIGRVYAETSDTEEQEVVELPPMKNYLEEEQVSDPRFFFTRPHMKGFAKEPLQVTFFSDEEVTEVRVSLPEEATLQKKQLPTGISAEEGAQPNEWIVQAKRAQHTFILPLVFGEAGNYEVSVEETTAHLEISEQEETSEEVPVEETESSEVDPSGHEKLEEEIEDEQSAEEVREPVSESSQEQQTDEEETDEASQVVEPTVFDGETAEVATMAELREAVANPDIGIISVQANLTGANATVLRVNRPLLIQGNGYTLNFGINGFYFQLAEVAEASVFRIENATLTKVGATPLINSTGTNSNNWTIELEDITEVNANTMRLASLPEGSIHFTGGVSNFTRTTSAQTFIVAKEVLATNQAEVTISRGNATVFFSSATVANPKLRVEQGAKVTITTTAGVANTIDLRGENPEVFLQSGELNVTTIGTTASPTNTTNNTIALTGISPKVTMNASAHLTVRSTLAKRGIHLAGKNAQLIVNNSKLSVTSATQATINMTGESPQLTFDSSMVNVTSTTGQRINLIGSNPVSKLENSQLEMNTSTGRGIYLQGATPQVLMDNSQLLMTDAGASQGMILQGTDALLSLSNKSELSITGAGTGALENIQIGSNNVRPELSVTGESKVSVTTSSGTGAATDTTNNTIHLRGADPKATVTGGSVLEVLITSNARRGVYLNGNNPELLVTDSQLDVTTVSGQTINLTGISPKMITNTSKLGIQSTTGQRMNLIGSNPVLKVENSQIDMKAITGRGIYLQGTTPQVLMDESQLLMTDTGASQGIILQGTDAWLYLRNQSEFKLTSGSGTASNILFSGARSRTTIENHSELILTTSGLTSSATDLTNNAIQFVGESSELTVRNQSILGVNVTTGAKRGIFFQNSSNSFQVDEESEVKISTEQANSLHMQGDNQKITIADKSKLFLKSNWNVHGSTTEHSRRSSLYIGINGSSNSKIEVGNQSRLLAESNLSSSIVLEGRVNSFYSRNKSKIKLYSGSTTSISSGAFATLRFLNSGDSWFKIENSMFSILKSGGSAPGIRMLGDSNSIEVTDGGIFQVKNPGNGAPSDGNISGGNQGVHLTTGDNTSFSVTDPGSQVTILCENGPAIDLSGTGKVKNSNGGYFEAVGRTATAEGGIFRAGVLEVEFDNPLFMDFRNNRQGGGNIFNVANGSRLNATNSDLTVWRIGSDLDGDPNLNFPTLDFSFQGTNFNTLGATSRPDILNTTTFGTAGLTTYSRLSSNNARWAIADELRVPTNADKKIHGHISIPVGLGDKRSAWDDEATVIVEVEHTDGTKIDYETTTVGHSNDKPGISIYGEEPRAGIFEIKLNDYLQEGDKVRIKEAYLTSGELSQGYENIILTETVEAFPIIPPTPAQFSSAIIAQDTATIQGVTDNLDAKVTATHNGEPLNTEAVKVGSDGRFTLDLSAISLEMDDEIQVFLRDAEGSAVAAGVVNPPETNNNRGNINPDTEFTFHDVTFEPATTLVVEDAGPVSPVDPLDPEVEVNPENTPELPEGQGLLSIDFVSNFNFGSQVISAHDQTYYAQPQRLINEHQSINEDEERPNYVQVTDRRSENNRNGWQLAVTQKEQFQTENAHELAGAQLQLMNQQLVTAQGGKEPSLQATNPLKMVPGNKRTLVRAEGSEGTGTWIYRFGDAQSADSSVALDVPKGATPRAHSYRTTLVWELSSVPDI